MGQLMVITTPHLAPGFQLAGVETLVAESPEQAEVILRQLLVGDKASLVVVQQSLLQVLSSALKRQIAVVPPRGETSHQPIIMAIPDARPALFQETRRHQLSELMRRTIGFQITFTAE